MNVEKCEFRPGYISIDRNVPELVRGEDGAKLLSLPSFEYGEIAIGCVRNIDECGARAKLEGANGAVADDGDYCIGGGPLRPTKCTAVFGAQSHNDSHTRDTFKYCFFKGSFYFT